MASSLVALQSFSALSFSTAVKGASLSAHRLAVASAIAPCRTGVTALLGFNKSAVPAKTTPAKKQPRTEDGIFGTSGGFGFTKANELFVGRMAMLGFAASLLGEAITGQGILSQLNLETGIPIAEAEPLLLFFIAFTVLGAIGGLGDRGRFVDDEAPAGPPVKPGSFKAALGLSEDGPLFGFTKANELFVGRMAQLGFAASLVGEVITGKGALAQLNIETGLPIFELEPLLLASIVFFFVAAINPAPRSWLCSVYCVCIAGKGASIPFHRLAGTSAIAPCRPGVTSLLGFNKSAVPAKTTPVKKQLRTEDGIFGTSGGFGFTKANELFVGRVAMLGFAASLLGEAVTGQGILTQFNLETGIPITEAEPLLLFFIAFTVLGAIGGLGDRGRFVDDEAPAGPPVKPGSFKAALGLSEEGPLFGFTKANELFVGRMAQLGFAASLVGEVITGRGALAQLNIETGLPIFELEPLLLASIVFFFVAAINPGTGKFINDEE
ncbi:unnamed protein product [Closterium sp. NIES-65]|nr:unnamed protein product [Closterium sp. NIES-65]